jgi:catechol 2,3-dioxygenase-like lactoylglutathione lyase family enzyme
MNQTNLSSSAIVFVVPEAEKTAKFYRDKIGFRMVGHFDKAEKFAALYRGGIEIIVVQAKFGEVHSNREHFGAGYDAYLVPENAEVVQDFYHELVAARVEIVDEPFRTAYGSNEFSFRDCDGHIIGVGCIKEKEVFFGDRP